MKTHPSSKSFLAGLVSLAFASTASALSYSIPSTPQTAVLTAPLKLGVTYLFEVSGTYAWTGGQGGPWADAEFSIRNGVINEIYPGLGLNSATDLLDLTIDGVAVDWLGFNGSSWAPNTYSPDHKYQYFVVGTGAPVQLQIADWSPILDADYTGDNFGSLAVQVTLVPDGGTTVVLLGVGLTGLALLRRRLS